MRVFIEVYKGLLYYTYMSKTKKMKSLWDKYGNRAIHAPEYKDSVKYIRKQREKE